MEKKTVSLIVPIYQITDELFRLTRAFFVSLDETEGIEDVEIIVVDNGSPIGGEVIAREADIYLRNRENLGFCKAVNQGFALAKGNFIVVANNDIRLSANWLAVTKDILLGHEDVGSVHLKMVGYDEPYYLGRDTWIDGKERWCHGSFYMIRKEALPEERYFEGYEQGGYDDYDFWHRMRDMNGWKQAYTNKAAFQHKDSSTQIALDQRDHDRAERDIRNRELYKKRFGEYPDIQFAQLFSEQMELPWKPFP